MRMSILFGGLILLFPAWGRAATFAFDLRPEGTALGGELSLTAATTGSLTGNYDGVENPAGTRTKPGLLGAFGSTENVSVPVQLTPAFSGPLDSVPTGSFALEMNEAAGTVVLSGLVLDLLPGGPVVIPSEVTLEFSTFRTRTPDSLFIGGFPVTIPLGESRLTALTAAQIGSAAGDLSAVGVDLWDFSISALMLMNGAFESVLGATPLPPVPVPLTLNGRIRVTGDTAEVTASSALDFSNSSDLGVALPSLPFGLPTVLPAGGTADVVFDLALESITADFSSTLSLAAPGVAVPEPAAVLVVGGMFWACVRRRRGV